jgi:hypothetical protein
MTERKATEKQPQIPFGNDRKKSKATKGTAGTATKEIYRGKADSAWRRFTSGYPAWSQYFGRRG